MIPRLLWKVWIIHMYGFRYRYNLGHSVVSLYGDMSYFSRVKRSDKVDVNQDESLTDLQTLIILLNFF